MKRIVIALGGNALLQKGDAPTIETQERRVKQTLTALYPLLKKHEVVITHGNGPAVGYLMLQQANAKHTFPLDVLDAETEGQIGYVIQQTAGNLFRKHNVRKKAVTVLTQVLVDGKDTAFKNPTKFVGPFYTKKEADKLKKFNIKEDKGRGWRRVVPSPKPLRIIEAESIEQLLEQKTLVIAAGGGGIPVVQKGKALDGVEAVVDKDRASACLATTLKAELLLIITGVDAAYENYGTKKARRISQLSVSEAEAYLNEGVFPEGSMGPKIEAAIDFVRTGKKRKVIITNSANVAKALAGKAGTHVVN